ncbi:MAG: phosphoribosylformylglycinamidine synthase subunit PurS [Syntrophothermus sp.]
MWLARIRVMLKKGVLDPQGKAVLGALRTQGYERVQEVRVGKYLEVRLDEMGRIEAEAEVEEMCRRLLSNPVIEDFAFELDELSESTNKSAKEKDAGKGK